MSRDRITVETLVDASLDEAWEAFTSPEHIMRWNFASDDWYCTTASADLKVGGKFVSRMEAKDGSVGFDFEGIYTKIIVNELIEYAFGHRQAAIAFFPRGEKILVRIAFDPEDVFPLNQQRNGWQAILDNYARYASSR